MATVVATPSTAGGYVKVVVDVSDDPAATGVVLERFAATADLTTAKPVRVRASQPPLSYNGATPAEPFSEASKGWAIYYDYEAPLGQPWVYRARSNNPPAAPNRANKIANASFEVDTAGWAAYNANATLARVTTWAMSGVASLQLTTATAGVIGAATSANVPVVAGKTYTLTAWAYALNGGRTGDVHIEWRDAAGTAVLSTTDGAATALPVNTVTLLTVSAVAPAGAANARVSVRVNAAAVGEKFNVDDGSLAEDYPPSAWPVSAPAVLGGALRTNLVANPSFEAGVTGWQASNANATVARSAAWAAAGTASLRVTCATAGDSSAVAYGTASGKMTPGLPYTVQAVAYNPTGAAKTVRLTFDWAQAGGAYIATAVGPWTALPAGGKVTLTVTGTAPALTAQINLFATIQGAAVGDAVHFDAFMFEQAASALPYVDTYGVTPDGATTGWLKDPARPANNVALQCARPAGGFDEVCDVGAGAYFIGLAGRKFTADAQNMDVPGAARGRVAYAVRKDFTSTLRLATRTVADRDALEALFAPGSPLLLQLPPEYAERDQYVQVGEVQEDRPHGDHRMPWRAWTLPYVVEDAPETVAQGPAGLRWRDLTAKYATWADVKAAGVTWDALGTAP